MLQQLFRSFILVAIAGLAYTTGLAQNSFVCAKVEDFALTTYTTIYLKCKHRWPDPVTTPGTFELWVFPNNWRDDPTKGPQPYISGNLQLRDSTGFFLQLNLSQPIQADRKYILIFRTATTPGVIDMFIEFSTEGKGAGANETKGVITPDGESAELGRKFMVTSSTNAPATVTVSPANPGLRKTHTVIPSIAILGTPKLNLTEQRGGATITHALENNGQILNQSDPEKTGNINATLTSGKKIRQAKATVGVVAQPGQPVLQNVLNQQLKVGDSLDLQPVPVGKDDASTFIQFSHFAGVGSKPGYSINVKEKTFLFLDRDLYAGAFLVQPDLLVDIGTNSLAKKSDDTIKIGFTATKTVLRGFGDRLQGLKFGPGVTYETNRGFHKSNLLFTFDSNPLLKNFYQSREVRRYEAAANQHNLSINDIPENDYKWGAGLEFFFGLEAGGALSSQNFQNKKKTASLTLPQYSIFRFRPKVHAFVEYDRFSLDWSGAMRGLLTPEYAGEELPNGTIRLRRISSWQAYSELTGAFLVDQSKHIAFTVTYKRGAQPPNYPHVQTVSTGLTLKY